MKVTFHQEALIELKNATEYYRNQEAALGKDFKAAFREAVKDISKQPSRYRVVVCDLRKCRFRRFPYSLYFRLVNKVIRVLVIKHDRRHPEHGMNRN